MLWSLPCIPLLGGALLATSGRWLERRANTRRNVAVASLLVLSSVLALSAWAAHALPRATLFWYGPLELSLQVEGLVRVAAVLVPVIALPVVAWASAHEPVRGLARLVGLLVAFVGSMEWLVLANDLLSLVFAWELLAGISWALIAHRFEDRSAVASAAYAFNVSRLGGLGLWVAAAAALSQTQQLGFESLSIVTRGPWGDALASGILIAAATKSAQGPFAPWLFRAMDGPSSASALLHSSTMVAAGAWLLIRLHEPLAHVAWLGPAAMALGLSTALVGGLVAARQGHAKRLLAASTSAQYGLMFAAVGAGYAAVAMSHLVAHAALKALLFLAAGMAISAADSEHLHDMGVGRRLPVVAAASWVGVLSLAAIPPLGAAWSKEQIISALGHLEPTLAATGIVAGALSAWYALRFQRLAFGSTHDGPRRHVDVLEGAALSTLAAISVVLGLVWVPSLRGGLLAWLGGRFPDGATWEWAASLSSAALLGAIAWFVHGRVARAPSLTHRPPRQQRFEWFGLTAAVRWLAIEPSLRLARASARFDDGLVDAGIRASSTLVRAISGLMIRSFEARLENAVAWAVKGTLGLASASRRTDDEGVDGVLRSFVGRLGRAASHARATQTGAVPVYYTLLTSSLLALVLALAFWRSG